MRLTELLKGIEIEEKIGLANFDCEIVGIYTDSKAYMPNGLFVCLDGGKVDSHFCVAEAVKNGAIVVVAERKTEALVPQIIVKDTRFGLAKIASLFYGEPSKKLKMVGISGTNGKTTTSYMLAEICKQAGKKVGVIGTLGICYATKMIKTSLTTPDPVFFQKTLAEMVYYGVEYVIMEVSAHALYYEKMGDMVYDACIFTNLTQDHLDFFKDMQEYKHAKLKLYQENCKIAVVNGDDSVGREIGAMRDELGLETIYYGIETPAEAFAVITDESLKGTECVLNLEDKLCRTSIGVIGRHNVYNAIAAACCAVKLGFDLLDISRGLGALKQVEGRLQWVGSLRGGEIFVDFAHTPDGIVKSLETLKQHCKGRLICVFGCGGNRDKSKRAIMGECVSKKVDFSVITSDNPRYEDPLDIIAEIEKGYRRFSAQYVVVPDRAVALDYALDVLRKNDILLVAGKGGEEYQEIMGIKHPFHDHTVLTKLIGQKSKKITEW